MRDLHYYALAIISYQNIAGPRCKVSDIVWVVYEYPRRRDDCGKDGLKGWESQKGGGWSEERRLSTLCPRHAYIRHADIHAVRFIFSWCSSRTLHVYTRLWVYVGIRVVPLSTCSSARVQRAAWPYNSNVETPLTGTRIPDITFTHVIPHQFLETKAANVWWREWDRWVSRRSSCFNFAGTSE